MANKPRPQLPVKQGPSSPPPKKVATPRYP
jgi:hypothetical protein